MHQTGNFDKIQFVPSAKNRRQEWKTWLVYIQSMHQDSIIIKLTTAILLLAPSCPLWTLHGLIYDFAPFPFKSAPRLGERERVEKKKKLFYVHFDSWLACLGTNWPNHRSGWFCNESCRWALVDAYPIDLAPPFSLPPPPPISHRLFTCSIGHMYFLWSVRLCYQFNFYPCSTLKQRYISTQKQPVCLFENSRNVSCIYLFY